MIGRPIIDPFHAGRDLVEGIETAIGYRTGRFTTRPIRIKAARKRLEGSGVLLRTCADFPHGNDHTAVKRLQAPRGPTTSRQRASLNAFP